MTLFTWIAADGRTTELTPANGYKVLAGVMGLDAPPVELNTEARTEGDGSLLVKRRTGIRHVLLSIFVDTGSSPRTAVAMLADVFRGPGTLRVSSDGSTFRNLRDAYYETGLEGDEGRGNSLPAYWRKVVVALQALDPWWYADAVTQAIAFGGVVAFDSAAVTFDSPTTPFDGGNATTFMVAGHADAYPVWTLTGPFTSLVVNVNTSGTFQLASALTAGNVITVDTRPGSRGPSLNGGAVDWALLTAASTLPTLPTGTVSVVASTAGTTGASLINVQYEPRWLTP